MAVCNLCGKQHWNHFREKCPLRLRSPESRSEDHRQAAGGKKLAIYAVRQKQE